MLILFGIVILIISFVIALVSMMREHKRIGENQKEIFPVSAQEEGQVSGEEKVEPLDTEGQQAPLAKSLDHLKIKIEELAAQEAGLGQPVVQKEVEKTKNIEQKVIEPQVVGEHDSLGDLFGSEHRFPAGTSGTISVQDLAKEKDDSGGSSS